METVECSHEERVETGRHGIQIGTCKYCGQVVQYDGDGKKAAVTKLGRLDGKIIIPNPRHTLQLDVADLAAINEISCESLGVGKKEKGDNPPTGLQFYRKNKSEMIRDLLVMSKEAFLEKWKVSAQTISHLKSDKLYKEHVTAPTQTRKAPRGYLRKQPAAAAARPLLPPLPPWSDTWPAEVQIKWLEIWKELHDEENKKGTRPHTPRTIPAY